MKKFSLGVFVAVMTWAGSICAQELDSTQRWNHDPSGISVSSSPIDDSRPLKRIKFYKLHVREKLVVKGSAQRPLSYVETKDGKCQIYFDPRVKEKLVFDPERTRCKLVRNGWSVQGSRIVMRVDQLDQYWNTVPGCPTQVTNISCEQGPEGDRCKWLNQNFAGSDASLCNKIYAPKF